MRRTRADAGTSRPRSEGRCRSCGAYSDTVSIQGFCTEDCARTGKDLMPEEIEARLAMRAALRRAGLLPRLTLDEAVIHGRTAPVVAKIHGMKTQWQGRATIAAAAVDYKRGQV